MMDEPWRELAVLARELLPAGRYEDYRAATAAAVRAHPDDAQVRVRHAAALSFTGRRREALEQIAESVELAPDDPIVLTRAADLLFDLGEYDTAQEYVTRVGELVTLAEFALGTELVQLAGKLAAQQGDLERAENLMRTVVNIGPEDPSHARFAKELAMYLAGMGKVEEARAVAARAFADHPDDDELRALQQVDIAPPS